MATTLPGRPGPESPAPATVSRPRRDVRRAGPDWLPVIGWFVEGGPRHSRVNVIPLGNSVDPSERFTTTLKFFRGSDQPVHTFTSEPFAGDHTFRYEGRALIETLGEPRFEGLVEITVRSLDHGPAHFPWLDSWMEFWADDGSLNGSVPGFVFKGGTTKRVMSGKWQHWPGIAANDQYASSVLLLNYHPRPTELRLDLFAPSGRSLSSDTVALPARMPHTVALDDHIPGARDLLAGEGGFGSLRIWTTYKVPAFVLMQHRASGIVTSFDHTVPYAGPPLD